MKNIKYISTQSSESSKPVDYSRFPSWVDPALQGLAFWIGYQRATFRDSILKEAAAEAELMRLAYSNIDSNYMVKTEITLNKLGISGELSQKRVDFITATKPNENNESVIQSVVEVKRAFSRSGIVHESKINDDLIKLAHIKKCHPNVRAFLVIVSESRYPYEYAIQRFSDDCGICSDIVVNKLKRIDIDNDHYCKVRKLKKAIGVVNNNKILSSMQNHYVALLEVM